MNSKSENATPDDELLTAYLDGELDEGERTAVESRLADDELLRTRLHELQKTWDVLDQLPQSRVNQSFTQSTLEIVVADAKQFRAGNSERWRWLMRVLIFAIAPAASMMLSYVAIQYWQGRTNRELLQQLPLIDNVDVYLKAKSPEFLTELKDSGLFDQNFEDLDGEID